MLAWVCNQKEKIWKWSVTRFLLEGWIRDISRKSIVLFCCVDNSHHASYYLSWNYAQMWRSSMYFLSVTTGYRETWIQPKLSVAVFSAHSYSIQTVYKTSSLVSIFATHHCNPHLNQPRISRACDTIQQSQTRPSFILSTLFIRLEYCFSHTFLTQTFHVFNSPGPLHTTLQYPH